MIDITIPPKLLQRQDVTIDQLYDLVSVANRLGRYDAADIIKNIIIDKNEKSNKHESLLNKK